jgi:hydroxypyruvate reductase
MNNIALMRRQAETIFQAGLRAVDPGQAVRRWCRLNGDQLTIGERQFDLARFERIILLGAGKAGAPMAQAVEEILGDRLAEGVVVVKYRHVASLRKTILFEAGHPYPDDNGLCAARQIYSRAVAADAQTLIIVVISGGGSALLPLPVDGITLADKQETTRLLLACGATIHEINSVRKHLSAVKGGQLARVAFPATVVALVLSDVVGDDLDTIASGPCVPDRHTYADCINIVNRYELTDRLPPHVIKHLLAGAMGKVPETPKPGDPVFDNVSNVIIASNYEALQHARQTASALGYHTMILSSMIEGETVPVAGMHMAMAREILRSGNPLPTPACILSGGETTVTIRGNGLGGRNQEFALAAALAMPASDGCYVLLSAGTDGSDGPTDAAGAFADSTTLQRAASSGLNLHTYLTANDSYHFFDPLGDLYKTGPTNTNVMDLRILLVTR